MTKPEEIIKIREEKPRENLRMVYAGDTYEDVINRLLRDDCGG